MAVPPPFVGREHELAALAGALEKHAVVVVHGPVGAGKTRLAEALMQRAEAARDAAFVRCEPGDRCIALVSRAERALDLLPGSLGEALRDQARVLIIDDVHHLAEADAAITL